MRLKPKRWTEHHNLRLFHVSMLAVFLMICVVVISGLFFILANSFAHADSVSQQADVTASATVPEFSPGTTTPITSGGGGSYFIPSATSTGPSLQYQFPPATITLEADPNISVPQNVIGQNGQPQRTIYVFKTDHPRFLGQTNVDNGFIFIDIEGPMSFISSAQASDNGAWQWLSPEALPAGVYTITAIVQDPWHLERTAAATLEFAIGKLGVVPQATKPQGGGAVLYLLEKIPQIYKIVRPGQEVGVAIKIISQSKAPKNIILEYTISNSQGTVGTYEDPVLVSPGGVEFLKTFYTNPLAQSGDYTITVRIHQGKQLISASDTFTVQGRGIIPTSGIMFVDFTTIFQILLVLFLLFGLIAYFEYNKVVVMSRIIRQVTEDDLKQEAENRNDKSDKN